VTSIVLRTVVVSDPDLGTGMVRIMADQQLDDAALRLAVDAAGYEVAD
jgi:hypothetical protein